MLILMQTDLGISSCLCVLVVFLLLILNNARIGMNIGPQSQASFPKIGIFVVTFNARATIGRVLARITPRSWDRIAEVFIFDDNSQDNTVQAAADYKYSHHLDKVRVYSNQVNLGYGGNQKRGYLYAIKHNFDFVRVTARGWSIRAGSHG